MKPGQPHDAVTRAPTADQRGAHRPVDTPYAGQSALTRRTYPAPQVGSAPNLTPVKSVE
jgi:hypothetical protein